MPIKTRSNTSHGGDNKPHISLTDLFKTPANFFAFGFGSGLSPWAPGTAGTLVSVFLYFIINLLSPIIYVVYVILAIAIGVYLCKVSSDYVDQHDDSRIVWDEIAGYGLTMLFLPISAGWALAGFVLFRLLDIFKPWPIGWVDRRIHGGTGIMLDDVIAGAMACGTLNFFHRVLL